jgi:uncharacterized protein
MRFVDTSYWVALRFARDRHHPDAAAIMTSAPGALLTTNQVIGETWTFLNRRAGHEAAVRFLDATQSAAALTIVWTDQRVEAEAWRWLRRHDERPYSFVDATSFAVMRRRRIREALAFDGDFTAAGFVEVRPSEDS